MCVSRRNHALLPRGRSRKKYLPHSQQRKASCIVHLQARCPLATSWLRSSPWGHPTGLKAPPRSRSTVQPLTKRPLNAGGKYIWPIKNIHRTQHRYPQIQMSFGKTSRTSKKFPSHFLHSFYSQSSQPTRNRQGRPYSPKTAWMICRICICLPQIKASEMLAKIKWGNMLLSKQFSLKDDDPPFETAPQITRESFKQSWTQPKILGLSAILWTLFLGARPSLRLKWLVFRKV